MKTATQSATTSTRRFKVPANFGKQQRAGAVPVIVLTPLTEPEKKELAQCEQTIQHGLQTFREVGEALFTIRDHRLYRATHATFELYCRAKWEFSKTQANRLIGAAEVVKNIEHLPGARPSVILESQVRPLVGLAPKKQEAIWKRVVAKAGGPENVTAALVSKAVNPVKPQAERRRSAPTTTVEKSKVIEAIEAEFRKNKDWPSRILSSIRATIKKL